MMIVALEDSPLRKTQECTKAKEAWEKLRQRYAGTMGTNELGLLNNLTNTKYETGVDMVEHVAMLKSRFSRLVTMKHILKCL